MIEFVKVVPDEINMGLKVKVNSPKVSYTNDSIESQYEYQTTEIRESENDAKYVVSTCQ